MIFFCSYNQLYSQNQGLEIYITDLESPFNKEYDSDECVCCLEPNPSNLVGEPILIDSDIIYDLFLFSGYKVIGNNFAIISLR